MNTLIAVRYKIVRDGITSILSEDPEISVIGTAQSQEELCTFESKGDRIDVVVLDLDIPDLNIIDTIEKVINDYSDTQILAMSDNEDPEQIRKVMKTGASGYIFKRRGAEELIKAIKEICFGKQYLCNETIALLIEGKESSTPGDKATNLTDRELQVLELICEEKINREIAEKLGISVRTVDAHRRNLLQKTGVKNTAGLVKFAIKHRLFELK